MPANDARPTAGHPMARTPRRLPWDARYEQLAAAAMPTVAEQGLAEFSLDEVASRADVTRNLLYHYFPRGRSDIVLAVTERAGRQLTDEWVVDDSVPLQERLDANNRRIIEQAMQPTDAWRIYRLARAGGDRELSAKVDQFVERVISSMSLNRLGTPDPPPLVRLALRGYVAFFETVLDEARVSAVPVDQVTRMLTGLARSVVQAGMSAGS